jgi:hypothetical protein
MQEKTDKSDECYLLGEVHEVIFLLIRPIYDDENLLDLFEEWAEKHSTNELRLQKLRQQMIRKKRAERKKLLAEQGLQGHGGDEKKQKTTIKGRVKRALRLKERVLVEEGATVYIVSGRYMQRGGSNERPFKTGVIRKRTDYLQEDMSYEVFVDGTDVEKVDEEGTRYERFAVISGRDLALKFTKVVVKEEYWHARGIVQATTLARYKSQWTFAKHSGQLRRLDTTHEYDVYFEQLGHKRIAGKHLELTSKTAIGQITRGMSMRFKAAGFAVKAANAEFIHTHTGADNAEAKGLKLKQNTKMRISGMQTVDGKVQCIVVCL